MNMKIIKRILDDVVIYVGVGLVLTAEHASNGDWSDTSLKLSNAALIEAEPPADFAGGHYTYRLGVFARTPQGEAAAAAAQRAQLQALRASLDEALEAHLLATAKARDYKSVERIGFYATSTHPVWGPEGRAFVAWQCDVFDKVFEIETAVVTGQRPPPTAAELIAELPVIVWPT